MHKIGTETIVHPILAKIVDDHETRIPQQVRERARQESGNPEQDPPSSDDFSTLAEATKDAQDDIRRAFER